VSDSNNSDNYCTYVLNGRILNDEICKSAKKKRERKWEWELIVHIDIERVIVKRDREGWE